jgi:serine/threonine protein kinase
MGEVYRARDTRLGRDVAVKVLPSHLSDNPDLKERFEREARAISQLTHPHICTLYDVGNHEGLEYLVMELLEGQTLADRLEKGALPAEQILKAGIEISDALDKAHRHAIVHRDLKPGNIMLTKSGVKLLDFGLAKNLAPRSAETVSYLPTEADRPLTEKGTIMGTFQYMAPEQLEGKEADSRTDIFSFGCVLYEMATGKKAFTGASQASLVTAIMSKDPEPISAIASMAPPALDRLVKTRPRWTEDRWQSARCEERIPIAQAVEAGLGGRRLAPEGERCGSARAAAIAAIALGAAHLRRVRPLVVRLHDPAAGKVAVLLAGDNAGPVAVSPDGQRAFAPPEKRPFCTSGPGCAERPALPGTEGASSRSGRRIAGRSVSSRRAS